MKTEEFVKNRKPINLSHELWYQADIQIYDQIESEMEIFIDNPLYSKLETKIWKDFYDRFNNNLIYQIIERLKKDLNK